MTGPAIKICGITTSEALGAAINARAEYAGLVFFPRSPRHVSFEQAAVLARQAEGRIRRVGLFVDATDELIADACAAARLDVIQCHGNEDPGRIAAIAARFARPVWKALAIATRADRDGANAFAGGAERVLLDAKTPPGTLPGGMGLSFDWSLLTGWKPALPWGLAGGLSPTNVAEAVALTKAPLVDCSSGVESAPGVKDPALIAAFCEAARGA